MVHQRERGLHACQLSTIAAAARRRASGRPSRRREHPTTSPSNTVSARRRHAAHRRSGGLSQRAERVDDDDIGIVRPNRRSDDRLDDVGESAAVVSRMATRSASASTAPLAPTAGASPRLNRKAGGQLDDAIVSSAPIAAATFANVPLLPGPPRSPSTPSARRRCSNTMGDCWAHAHRADCRAVAAYFNRRRCWQRGRSGTAGVVGTCRSHRRRSAQVRSAPFRWRYHHRVGGVEYLVSPRRGRLRSAASAGSAVAAMRSSGDADIP